MKGDEVSSSRGRVNPWGDPKTVMLGAAFSWVGNALFPRLAYRSRWHTRLSPRRFTVYVFCTWVEIFAVRTWGPVLVKRLSRRAEAMKAEVARELGHEPTPQEAGDYFRRRWEAKHAPRQGRPTDTAQGASG